MKVAVAGATGNVGSLTVERLEHAGHDVVRISRATGIDLVTGAGLDGALAGVEAVIDVTNLPAESAGQSVERFGVATSNLLSAAAGVGVRHHVLLSILGLDRVEGNAHYAGKREQERLVRASPVPWTIVRAAQFHDFAEMVARWTEQDGSASVPPLLLQPIAPSDVADVLVETAGAAPARRSVDVAGPEPQDLVDMARRTHAVRGRAVRLVPSWSSTFDASMAGEVLLPGEDARLAPTTFDDWLAEQA